MGYSRQDLLVEENGAADGSGQYVSHWAETSGYSSALIVVYGVLNADTVVVARHGFPTPPDDAAPYLSTPVPVVSLPGGYYSFGQVPLYMRMVSVLVNGAAATDQLVVSIRGLP